MPLALQALLPFVFVLGAWAGAGWRPRRRINGAIAAAGTLAAAIAVLVELLRLAPAEHVDVPYLRTFPFADLSIRLDGLSLAFAAVMLVTATFLMLVRLTTVDDRREPWRGWLLTTAAALAVIMAANLLLLYAALQLLTLAWSGALDETARRSRPLRLAQQVADVGLLAVAGQAIQATGTSGFSGLPSDSLGPAAFVLAALPALARLVGLWTAVERPRAGVLFEPAVAWTAPGGYLLLRLLALTGGRPPGRPLQVALYAGGLVVAAALLWITWRERGGSRLIPRTLVALAAVGLALSAPSNTIATLAGVWTWLALVAVTGLASVRLAARGPGRTLLLANLALLPPSILFIGVWLTAQALIADRLGQAAPPLWLLAVGSTVAVASFVRPSFGRIDIPAVWGALLLLAGAFPSPVLALLVAPAAHAVRNFPAGAIQLDAFGIATGTARWPAALVSATVITALVLVTVLAGGRLPLLTGPATVRHIRLRLSLPRLPDRIRELPWPRLAWLGYATVAALVVLR